MEALSLNSNCDDYLVAFVKLLRAGKLHCDDYSEVINLLEGDEKRQDLLKTLFEALVRKESFDKIESFVKFLTESKELIVMNDVRLVRLLSSIFLSDQTAKSFFEQISNRLIGALTSPSRSELHLLVFNLLTQIISRDEEMKRLVCERIIDLDDSGSLSLRNLSCFFDKIIESGILLLDDSDLCDLLIKYFSRNDQLITSQGIFVIKTLIKNKKVSSRHEKSFKNFAIVFDAIIRGKISQETLKTAEQIDFKKSEFVQLHFYLEKALAMSCNGLGANWGVKRLLNGNEYDDGQILEILNVLNSTSLYEINDSTADWTSMKKFFTSNFDRVFNKILEIQWENVPFFEVLKTIEHLILQEKEVILNENHKVLFPELCKKSNKIKSFMIRSGVQMRLGKIAKHAGVDVSFPAFKRTPYDKETLPRPRLDEALNESLNVLSNDPTNLSALDKTSNYFFYLIRSETDWTTAATIKNMVDKATKIFNIIMNIEDDQQFESFYNEFLYAIFQSFSANASNSEWMNQIYRNVFMRIESFHKTKSDRAKHYIYNKMTRYPVSFNLLVKCAECESA